VKQYTTRVLKSVAAIYLAFPLAYLVFAATVFNIPLNTLVRVVISPLYLILSILAVVTGYGLWEMRRWSWYVFLITNGLVIYANAIFLHDLGETHHRLLSFLVSLGLICALVYQVAREVRVPYFFPKIRWWESNPRYRLSVPATLHRKAGPISGEIQDISIGGCFIKLRTECRQDEELEVEFKLFGHALKCKGRIVWCTISTVTHPRGIGIKFDVLPKGDRRALRAITRRLRKIGVHYRKSRYLMNQEEFLQRLEELESAGTDKDGRLA